MYIIININQCFDVWTVLMELTHALAYYWLKLLCLSISNEDIWISFYLKTIEYFEFFEDIQNVLCKKTIEYFEVIDGIEISFPQKTIEYFEFLRILKISGEKIIQYQYYQYPQNTLYTLKRMNYIKINNRI